MIEQFPAFGRLDEIDVGQEPLRGLTNRELLAVELDSLGHLPGDGEGGDVLGPDRRDVPLDLGLDRGLAVMLLKPLDRQPADPIVLERVRREADLARVRIGALLGVLVVELLHQLGAVLVDGVAHPLADDPDKVEPLAFE